MGVRRSDCGGASTATVSDTAHHTAKGDIMATIHDVAIATGVSDATVSRALRGMNSVRPSTRQLVLDAARRLDFTLSRSASSLASGKTMRVVMLFGCTIASWFNASCIEGALETLEPPGYDLVPVRVCDLEQLHGFFADLPSRGSQWQRCRTCPCTAQPPRTSRRTRRRASGA